MTDKTLPAFPVKLEDWSEQSAGNSLNLFFERTIAAAEGRIDWYSNKGSIRGRQSRHLRMGAVFAGTVGALLPLVQAAAGSLLTNADGTKSQWGNLGPWGYVALAVAGALVAGDRLFGVSSSWIRFRRAETQLNKLLVAFRSDWAIEMSRLGGVSPGAEKRSSLLEIQKNFVVAVEEIVERETETWIMEFKTSLAELSGTYGKKKDSAGATTGTGDSGKS